MPTQYFVVSCSHPALSIDNDAVARRLRHDSGVHVTRRVRQRQQQRPRPMRKLRE